MKTRQQLTPADPDQTEAAAEAARFRATATWVAVGILGVAALTFVLAVTTGETAATGARTAGASALFFGAVLNICRLLLIDFRPHLAVRLGLSRAESGDERERRIASNTTVRVYAATNLVIMLWAVFVADEWPIVYILLAGTLADPLIAQIRLRRS